MCVALDEDDTQGIETAGVVGREQVFGLRGGFESVVVVLRSSIGSGEEEPEIGTLWREFDRPGEVFLRVKDAMTLQRCNAGDEMTNGVRRVLSGQSRGQCACLSPSPPVQGVECGSFQNSGVHEALFHSAIA